MHSLRHNGFLKRAFEPMLGSARISYTIHLFIEEESLRYWRAFKDLFNKLHCILYNVYVNDFALFLQFFMFTRTINCTIDVRKQFSDRVKHTKVKLVTKWNPQMRKYSFCKVSLAMYKNADQNSVNRRCHWRILQAQDSSASRVLCMWR